MLEKTFRNQRTREVIMRETNWKKRTLISIIISLLVLTSLAQSIHLGDVPYYKSNAIAIHTILEFFSIFVCFVIGTYGWLVFKETKSTTFLLIFPIFFAVGLMDLMHVITYKGMPFFITESSGQKTVWFWIVGRFTQAFGILSLLLLKDKPTNFNKRGWLLSFVILYVLSLSATIFIYEEKLPTLVISGVGTTPLKNGLEYFVSSIQFVSILIALKRYRKYRDSFEVLVIFACTFILISEILLTFYSHVSDFEIISAHVYKAIGYALFLRAFYFSKLQLSFTHKTKVEKDFKKTRSILDSFFLQSPDSITILDLNGVILSVNPGFEKVYGWTKEEAIGKRFRDFMPEIKNDIDRLFEEVYAGRSFIGYETVRYRKDGKKILVNMTISPVKNEKGEIIQISSISRDITEQKEMEERMRKVERELKDAVGKQQGIMMKFKKENDQFIHTLCDGKLLSDVGLTPEKVIGKDPYTIFDGETAAYISSYYESAWKGQEVAFEVTLKGKTCFTTLTPIIVNEEVTEVIGSSFDISKLKNTEDLLQKSEKLAVVGELAAGVAHEIRNPLTTLKGFTQLLGSGAEAKNKEFVNLMLSELDRIEMITNEFMVVAKPQAIQYQENDIQDLLRQVMLFSKPQAVLSNVEIEVSYTTTDTIVLCDGNQIKQVFINLIKNAFEAMHMGGILKIEVSKSDDGCLVIRIADTGIGIPEDIIPRLGEPFYSLKEKGTGLGLMVSFRIIEAHNGSIGFVSKQNEGTTVEVKLPLLV